MSAIDRIRASILHEPPPEWVPPGSERKVVLSPEDAEALCDLADAARARHSKQGCMTCDFDDPCVIADALARLDGEDGP